MKSFLNKGFIVLLLITFFAVNNVVAEGVLINEDFTDSGYVDGDVVIINGNLITPDDGNNLVINGDLKIINGYAHILGAGQSFTVYGDVIITNTSTSGTDDIDKGELIVNQDIVVYGDIYTRSVNSYARVYSQEGAIKAGNITLHGLKNSHLDTESYIDVKGDITLISDEEDSRIQLDKPGSGYLHANNITTSAYGKAWIGFLNGHNGGIEVAGDISLMSSSGDAYIEIVQGDIYAGSITTSASGGAYVNNWNGDITIRGPIKTYSLDNTANIFLYNGSLIADSIYTDAKLSASVIDEVGGIVVKGNIFTLSREGSAKVATNMSDIYAGSITTSGYTDARVLCYDSNPYNPGHPAISGSINVVGSIITVGVADDAMVQSSSGYIKAGEIFTNGRVDGYVQAGTFIDSKGPIVTEGYRGGAGSDANVKVENGYLKAEEIFTHGGSNSSVEVSGGDVDVRGDIYTKSDDVAGISKINVDGGNLYARNIRTEGVLGDDSIVVSGVAEFGYIPREGDALVEFANSEFHFNSDQAWSTQLTVSGACTFNGDGMMLTFGDSGSILVKSGGSLLLNNIVISNVGFDMIRCEDDTATISLQNVTWTLTDNFTFGTGRLDILDNFVLRGNKNLMFHYTSSVVSTVADHAAFILDHAVTFSYDSHIPTCLQMQGAGSSLVLNKSRFVSGQDCVLGCGNLFTNGLVVLDADVSRTLDLSGLGGIYVNGSLSRGSYVYLP